MSIYTVIRISLLDGRRSEIAAPFSSKRKAIACAEEHKAPGAYCIVQKSETGVAPHQVYIYTTEAGRP